MGTAKPPSYTYNLRKDKQKRMTLIHYKSMHGHRLGPKCAEGWVCGWKGKGSKSLKSFKFFETIRFVNICDSFIQDKIVGDFIVCFATVQEKIS